ncbi:MAG: XTP/dITP diphosphohydrolase [Flavobacteriales bacterium]|jgi:XTP/dITP diphosphohydrolase
MQIVFATNNSNKVKEIQALIDGKMDILSLKDVQCFEELPETQETLVGNAIQKAQYLYDNYGKDCFADDTGLLISSLNDEPGVYTARYAGPQRDANDNMDLVLTNLEGREDRSAKFQTAIALIIKGTVTTFVGEARGTIAMSRQGEEGFGYDPIFIPEGEKRSFAEMPLSEKNKISHRGRAVAQLVEFLNNDKY